MKIRKQPMRKCTGCQEMKNKKELIRVVRNESGEFSIDFVGKKPGRGAYVCPTLDCFDLAKKNKGFERSFKSQVPLSVYESLLEELNNHG